VNGCALGDTTGQSGRVPSAECRGFDSEIDQRLAGNLMKIPGSAVLHNVGAYLGAGFIF
jgi:hypothetical protein